MLLAHFDSFEIINVQGNRMITLGDIIEVSKELLGKNPEIIEKSPEQVSVRTVSNEKAKELIQWEAKINLEEGLETVANFMGIETKNCLS